MYTKVKFMDNTNAPGEKTVRGGLSFTPSQVSRLTSEGKAVAMGQLAEVTYFDGLAEGVLPLETRRGIDDNDVWEASYEAQEKIRKFVDYRARQHKDPVPDSQ